MPATKQFSKINEVVNSDDGTTFLKFKTGGRSGRLRDFFEFYVDDKPLIHVISRCYWKIAADTNSEFFNTQVGCLGAFGKFWDEISIRILLKEAFTEHQSQQLFELFKSNYQEESRSEQEIKNLIVEFNREDFLFYRCQDCRDSGCGGMALDIIRADDKIIWTDHKEITIYFDLSQYEKVLYDYLDKVYKK